MREYVNITVRFTKEELIEMLTTDVFDNTDDAFNFITLLELAASDADLCLRLAEHFNKERKKIEEE